jgi:hypothetical protein
MKSTKTIFTLAFILCSIFFMTCTQKHEESSSASGASSHSPEYEKMLKDTLALGKFQEWTSRWNRTSKAYMDSTGLRYFSMPIIDMKEFVGEKAKGARFYIGMDSTSQIKLQPHIILASTDGKGKLLYDDKNKIFDVSNSCPPFCGEE